MTQNEMEVRIQKIENAIAGAYGTDMSSGHILELGGEWKGLKKALGQWEIGNETMWAMISRCSGRNEKEARRSVALWRWSK